MDWKELISGFILLIVIYLLVNNATNTNQVIASLTQGLTSETQALQGRGVTSSATIPTITV